MCRRLVLLCIVLTAELAASFTILRPLVTRYELAEASRNWKANPTPENSARLEQERVALKTELNQESTIAFLILAAPTVGLFLLSGGARKGDEDGNSSDDGDATNGREKKCHA